MGSAAPTRTVRLCDRDRSGRRGHCCRARGTMRAEAPRHRTTRNGMRTRDTESVGPASYVGVVALTEADLERVPVELIDIGEFVLTKAADGQPCVWQVHARKFSFNEHDGQFVELKPGELHRAFERQLARSFIGSVAAPMRLYVGLPKQTQCQKKLPQRYQAYSPQATFARRRFCATAASDPGHYDTLDEPFAGCTVRVGSDASSNRECISSE